MTSASAAFYLGRQVGGCAFRELHQFGLHTQSYLGYNYLPMQVGTILEDYFLLDYKALHQVQLSTQVGGNPFKRPYNFGQHSSTFCTTIYLGRVHLLKTKSFWTIRSYLRYNYLPKTSMYLYLRRKLVRYFGACEWRKVCCYSLSKTV